MSAAPTKYRYGARLRGTWLWPRGCWEYNIEKAQAAALRTWPHATMVGVEPTPSPDGSPATGERWICERIDFSRSVEWRLEATRAAAAPAPSVVGSSAPAPSSSATIDPDRMWWNRDD